VQCIEGRRNKNFSIEHVSPAESKSNHQEGRSAGRSEIMTFTPFKNSLFKVTKKRRAKDPTRPKGKLFDGPNVGRPSFSGKKKKKENIFCAQCDEQYEGTTAEEWIKCMKYQRWYHEQCCSFDGDLTFNCNVC
jgi:predicted nucleic acid binding AN1-type Zn finger protein